MEKEEQPAAELSNEERIEAYFTTDDKHWNQCAYSLYDSFKFWDNVEGVIILYRECLQLIAQNSINPHNPQIVVFRLCRTFKESKVCNIEDNRSGFENTVKEFIVKYLHLRYSKDSEVDFYRSIASILDSQIEEHFLYQRTLGRPDWNVFTNVSYAEDDNYESKTPKSPFKLSDKRGSKTDLIRVLNALYELNLIELENGQRPTKGQFMKQVGGLLGVDLNGYEQALSKALEQSLEANSDVFERMKDAVQAQVFARQESSRK